MREREMDVEEVIREVTAAVSSALRSALRARNQTASDLDNRNDSLEPRSCDAPSLKGQHSYLGYSWRGSEQRG